MPGETGPNWFQRTFGNEQTGVQTGAVVSVLASAIGGYFLGGWGGGALGILGGTLLAPVINELFHNWFGGRMPARPDTITVRPTVEHQRAPIRQPDGQMADRVVATPILDRLTVPEGNDIQESIQARNAIREMLVGGGNLTTYNDAVRRARTPEARVEAFFTGMRDYHQRQQQYQAGEYQELIASVTRASSGMPNPLSEGEVRAFVPELPSVESLFARHPALTGGSALAPISVSTYREANHQIVIANFDIDAYAQRHFARTRHNGNVAEAAAAWAQKSYVERMNIAQNAVDDARATFEYGNSGIRIDWDKIGGRDRWRDLIAVEAAKGPQGNISRVLIETAQREMQGRDDQTMTAYRQIIELAPMVHVSESLQGRLMTELRPAVQEMGEFRNSHLVAAHRRAMDFVHVRREIFNQEGIAIFNNGQLDAAKVPGGGECFYITARDCRDASRSGKRTYIGRMVGANFAITHVIDGDAANLTANSPEWNSGRLATPVTVDRATFTELSGDSIPTERIQALRAAINSANGGRRVAAATGHSEPAIGQNPALLALNGEFSRLEGGHDVATHSQPTGIPARVSTARRTDSEEPARIS